MEKFQYRVSCQGFEMVEVAAVDKLRAVAAAAQIWGVPWTTVARQCGCENLGPAKEETPAMGAPAKKTANRKPAAKKQ